MRLPHLMVKRKNGERCAAYLEVKSNRVTSDPRCQKKYDPVYKLRRDPHMHKHFRD